MAAAFIFVPKKWNTNKPEEFPMVLVRSLNASSISEAMKESSQLGEGDLYVKVTPTEEFSKKKKSQ